MTRAGAAVTPLIVAALVFVAAARDRAQVIVPPSASLDIQVPAAPTPVTIGGRIHVVYELHITNFRSVDVLLTTVDVLAADDRGTVLATYRDADLSRVLAKAGAPRSDTSDRRLVGSGRRVVLFVWLPLEDSTQVPTSLRHRISLDVMSPSGREPGSVEGAATIVRRDTPVVLDPPLRGGPWVAVYDHAMDGGHRRALFAIGGRSRIPARFAIDWVRLGDDGLLARGDSAVLSNSYGYGEDVLAVGAARVADVKDGVPEPTPAISLDNASGNYVTLDLGDGRFAVYEHLQTGSIRVRAGDRVTSGQVIAKVGGSGSVSAGPHLHFHVADASSPLGAEGLPYVFRSFEHLGAFDSIAALASGRPWAPRSGEAPASRRMELPLQQTVLRF